MRNHLFSRLAVSNIKKQRRVYVPYMLASIGSIMMFYNFCALTFDDKGTGASASLQMVMMLGIWVVALFSVLFLFYTNSFLIKRRTKEFGLYNLLGMEKKHVARVVAAENLITSCISLLLGLGLGILLNKGMFLLLCQFLHTNVRYGFSASWPSIVVTIILFCAIFLLTLLYNIHRIARSKPIELMQSARAGEKEPKTKWLLAIIGLLCLGVAYWMALVIESPLAAVGQFFLAVILVIVGTYCLFTAGSIWMLKLMRRSKRYYYQARHFTTVSGMLYRMKQNAAGLASICILSTMVLVMVSTTTSLYFGIEDSLETRFPQQIMLEAQSLTSEEIAEVEADVRRISEKHGASVTGEVKYRMLSRAVLGAASKGIFEAAPQANYTFSMSTNILIFISQDEYERLSGIRLGLEQGEIAACEIRGGKLPQQVSFAGETRRVVAEVKDIPIDPDSEALLVGTYYIITPDEADALALTRKMTPPDETINENPDFYYGFDVDGSEEAQIAIMKELYAQKIEGKSWSVDCRADSRKDFSELCGGLFFLGMFLGLLFSMGNVMIIYYKQLSEGYDDRERFQIMQKVGMSREEVKKTIRSQVLTVFFLPLAAAALHVAVSFKMITLLLRVLGLVNVRLFAACAVGSLVIFALLYTGVYALTARTYYKIVET